MTRLKMTGDAGTIEIELDTNAHMKKGYSAYPSLSELIAEAVIAYNAMKCDPQQIKETS